MNSNEILTDIDVENRMESKDLNKTSDNNTSIDEQTQARNSDEVLTKSAKKRKRHRRGRKRRKNACNPYKLSGSEYEKKECERLQRNRDKMVKQGKTLAPFNTTQFIMDEHRDELPKFDSVNSSDMESDTTAEENYLTNEFNEEYEIIKLEYYKKLNKNELLNECLQILTELNKLQDVVAKLTNENENLKKQLNERKDKNDSSVNDVIIEYMNDDIRNNQSID